MKKQDIICISMTTWEGDYMKTIVHMMSQLAKNHRVLFVDYAFTWKDVLFTLLGKSQAPVSRMLGWKPGLRTLKTRHGNEIYHLTLPPVIPINWIKSPRWFALLLKWQSVTVTSTLRKVMKQLKFNNTVMINAFHPVMGVALYDKLDVKTSYYYCYDEIRAAQWAGVHGGNYEDLFIPKVDQVIVTSAALYEDRRKKHDKVTLIKNGVDFELFNQGFEATKHTGSPVVGYLGSIDDRLDYDLLQFLITQKPNWEFHFVGRVTYPAGKEKLTKYENVTFFGAQQPDSIPGFLKAFGVGIIPFATNEFTKNIYPLKINEYLAAGKPVVSTDFADLSDFTNLASIHNDQGSFLDALENALSETGAVDQRISMAKTNSWETRAAQLEELLAEALPESMSHA
jgi:glycosyltransferase involved in cell wall biosynthesis